MPVVQYSRKGGRLRKLGFGIFLSLVLAVALVLASVGTIGAAPTPKSWITITHLAEDEIAFDYGWNKVNVYAYSVYVLESGVGYSYYFHHGDLGVRTTNLQDSVSASHTGIDVGDQNIYVRLWLYGKNGKMIKNARLDMRVQFP